MSKKENMLRAVVAMTVADGVLDKRERRLLEAFSAQLGLGKDRLDAILGEAREGRLQVEVPEDEDELMDLFDGLISVAISDGEVAERERKTLEGLGRRLGLDPSDVDAHILEKMKRLMERANRNKKSE